MFFSDHSGLVALEVDSAFFWAAHHRVTSELDFISHGISVFFGVVWSEVIAVGEAECFESVVVVRPALIFVFGLGGFCCDESGDVRCSVDQRLDGVADEGDAPSK